MRERINDKRRLDENMAHIHGYVNGIDRINDLPGGKKSIFIRVGTEEVYQKDGEWKSNKTFHNVNIITDKKEILDAIDKISKDLQANKENKNVEGYKPVYNIISCEGPFVERKNETEEKTYYNQFVVAKDDSIAFTNKMNEKETRNSLVLKGFVSKVNIIEKEGVKMAAITVATHFYTPEFEERTSFNDAVVSAKRFPKTFDEIKEGSIKVGDAVELKAQMHNRKEGNGMILNISSIAKITLKKDLKEAETKAEAPKEEAPKEAVKEAPKKEEKPKKAVSNKKQRKL